MPNTVEYEDCTDCCLECDGNDCLPACDGGNASVTPSGIGTGTCTATECSNLNTAITLLVGGHGCLWNGTVALSCASAGVQLRYFCSLNLLRLTFLRQTGPGTTIDIAVYEVTPSIPFLCSGNYTVTKVSDSGHCSFPSSLTVNIT